MLNQLVRLVSPQNSGMKTFSRATVIGHLTEYIMQLTNHVWYERKQQSRSCNIQHNVEWKKVELSNIPLHNLIAIFTNNI